MKGLIALDIDGTLTVGTSPLSLAVVDYLHQLVDEGFALVFITGRTFHWGQAALKDLHFPYYYAIQNGSTLLQMPEKSILLKNYLASAILPEVEKICDGLGVHYVVYSGIESGERCYFHPNRFDEELLIYAKNRARSLNEEWIPIHSYHELPVTEFPVIKFFGKEGLMQQVAEQINQLGLHAPVIRDPYTPGYSILQATCDGIDKGRALRDIKRLLHFDGFIIGAGDDYNDIPLLNESTIKIVMDDAPEALKEMATIVAPKASEDGIIQGLKQAIRIMK